MSLSEAFTDAMCLTVFQKYQVWQGALCLFWEYMRKGVGAGAITRGEQEGEQEPGKLHRDGQRSIALEQGNMKFVLVAYLAESASFPDRCELQRPNRPPSLGAAGFDTKQPMLTASSPHSRPDLSVSTAHHSGQGRRATGVPPRSVTTRADLYQSFRVSVGGSLSSRECLL